MIQKKKFSEAIAANISVVEERDRGSGRVYRTDSSDCQSGIECTGTECLERTFKKIINV